MGALPGLPLSHSGNDAVDFVGADDRVHFGHFRANVAAVALDQAAGDDQALRAAGLLVLGHLEDGVDRFLLGGVDEAARVDDDDVGLLRVRRQLVAAGRELAHHDLGIDEILGTPQTDKTNFQGGFLAVCGLTFRITCHPRNAIAAKVTTLCGSMFHC